MSIVTKDCELIILGPVQMEQIFALPIERRDVYYTVEVVLRDGRNMVAEIANIYLYYVEGYDYIPFSLEDITGFRTTSRAVDRARAVARIRKHNAMGLIDYEGLRVEKPGSIPRVPDVAS